MDGTAESTGRGATGGGATGRSVLIVDDDADIRLAIRLTLEWAPGPFHVVAEASSGEEALARWRELRPEVVILDDHLPGQSGLDTARSILAEEPAQHIVLCTGLIDPSVELAASELGIAAVLKTNIGSLPILLQA